MNRIYAITSKRASTVVMLDAVWTQDANGDLPAGYTSLVPVQVGKRLVLFAYNKATQKTDTYTLSDKAPWVRAAKSQPDLSGPDAWDTIDTFVLGNQPYLVTYCRESGAFGFYQVASDLSVSKPYRLAWVRNTPTTGFTTVAPYTSLGQQYVLGYDFDTGTVANFSVTVTSSSADGPPLRLQNVWYHQWAKGWTRFAFFQLGGSNFFFKINTAKLNVNIDHMQDNPAAGSVEVGSYLQSQLPDALSIRHSACLPWSNGEPYLLTHIASNGLTAIYRIHADCLGWTKVHESVTVIDSETIIPYRIGNKTLTLYYGG